MTEQRFDELINLYLDNEIGRHEVGELKQAMHSNLLRRRKFERACELHQAARKALATKAEQTSGTAAPTPAVAAMSAPSPKMARDQGRPRTNASSGGKDRLEKKQSQARRNASVDALAQRQSQKGAASEVDITKIRVESRRNARPELSVNPFSFFNSPLGMFIGAVLTGLFGLGLFFFLKVATPDDNDDGSVGPGTPVIHVPDVNIDPKVLKELTADQAAKAGGTDAVHNQVYQAALAGLPATNAPAVNYFTSKTELVPESNAPADRPATNDSIPVPAGAGAKPASTDLSASNLPSPAPNGLPNTMGLPPGQGEMVRLALPSSMPSMPSLDGQTTPANTTAPPVKMP